MTESNEKPSSLFNQWRVIEELGLEDVVHARVFDVLQTSVRKTFSWAIDIADNEERFRQTIRLADALMERCPNARFFTFARVGLISGYFLNEG